MRAEQEDGDQPHNEKEDDHEGDLDFAHTGTEAASGDGGKQEQGGASEIADFAAGEAVAAGVNGVIELLVEVFAEQTDGEDVEDNHNGDEGEEGAPVVEDDLEGGDGVVEQTGGFDRVLVIFAVRAAEGAVAGRVRGAVSLTAAFQFLKGAADFATEVAEGREVVAREFGGFRDFIGFRVGAGLGGLRLGCGLRLRRCFCHVPAFQCVSQSAGGC